MPVRLQLERGLAMMVKIEPRKVGEQGGIACLPLVKNVPTPRAKDWKKTRCRICGEECWESDLARQAIAMGSGAACTLCALAAGMNER